MVTESPIRGRSNRNAARYSDEHVSGGPSNSTTSSTRSSRTKKRLNYYDNDSDEEDDLDNRIPAKRRAIQTSSGRYVKCEPFYK